METNYKGAVDSATAAIEKQKTDFEAMITELTSEILLIETSLDGGITTSSAIKTDTDVITSDI